MAERKAVNKYYPPEWTPQQGSINKFKGTHALRERARKLHMGILIIRFEMPYNIWCNGCEKHIGMGVRYNAEKTKVGMYYTTPIYKFRMKCHLCTNHFEIQTDPQNMDYVILSGARRQERRWDPSQNDQVAPEDKDIGKKLALDAMYRLEHGANDKAKQKALAPTLTRLEEFQERWKYDYELNKVLRNTFREKKKSLKVEELKDNVLRTKYSLDLALLPESSDDLKLASLMKLAPRQSVQQQQELKRDEIISRPLFTKSSKQELRVGVPPTESNKTFSTSLLEPADVHSRKASKNKPVVKCLSTVSASSSPPPPIASEKTDSSRPSLVAFEYDSSNSDDSCT